MLSASTRYTNQSSACWLRHGPSILQRLQDALELEAASALAGLHRTSRIRLVDSCSRPISFL